jgi:general secretion pathway protein F
MLYQYSALDQAGNKTQGQIQAESEKQLRNKLRAEGLIPVDIYLLSSQSMNISYSSTDKKIAVEEICLFTRELAAMVNAGLEIQQSIASCAEQSENAALKIILQQVDEKIKEGYSFSASLECFPKAFPKVYLASIRAGEEAGQLGIILELLADYLERQQQIRQKILQAILYPIILGLVSISIVIFLLTFVTPKIIGMYQDSQDKLPAVTKALIHLSDFFQAYGIIVLIGLVVIWLGFKQLIKTQKIKSQYHKLLLQIPLLGKTIKKIETSRFLRTLAILSHATVPILEAFQAASELVLMLPIKQAVLEAKDQVREGATLYQALKRTHYFSPSALQFISAGEQSGELDKMLMRSANHQDEQVKNSIDALLTIIEPAMILIMGGIVMFIVLATLLPIFQLSSQIS